MINNLNELGTEVHRTAVSKGWWDPSFPRSNGDLLMLIVCEVSEAMEELRDGAAIGLISYEHTNPNTGVVTRTHTPKPRPEKPGKPVGFPIELADVIIRTLDLATALGIDISEAVRIKMAYNATRPQRHGGKAL